MRFSVMFVTAGCVFNISYMTRSLGLKICWKMEIKIDETYHVASFFVLNTYT